jgi:hypothetical protein
MKLEQIPQLKTVLGGEQSGEGQEKHQHSPEAKLSYSSTVVTCHLDRKMDWELDLLHVVWIREKRNKAKEKFRIIPVSYVVMALCIDTEEKIFG